MSHGVARPAHHEARAAPLAPPDYVQIRRMIEGREGHVLDFSIIPSDLPGFWSLDTQHHTTTGDPFMNRDQIKGQWKQIEAEAKRMWAKLTDDDWKVAAGDIQKLAGRIQERYGDAKEVVMERIGKILRSIGEGAEKAAGRMEAPRPAPAPDAPIGKKS